MDCRPVTKGYPLNKALEKAAIRQYIEAVINRTAPTQFGCALRGGGSQLIMSIQAHMEAHPEHVCVSTDISNAYNEIQCTKILESVWERKLTEEEFLDEFMQDPNNSDPALKELFI
jgi:hypothetical protein